MKNALRKVLLQVMNDIGTNLNDYISDSQLEGEDWFTELEFHDDAPRWQTDRFYMGIYLSSPEGSVYEGNIRQSKYTVMLDCILDDARENSNNPQLYLNAVIDFLRGRVYGSTSAPTIAQTARVDLEAPVNAFMVAIEIVVFETDYDK